MSPETPDWSQPARMIAATTVLGLVAWALVSAVGWLAVWAAARLARLM